MRTLVTCLGMTMLVLSACGSGDGGRGAGTGTGAGISTGTSAGIGTGTGAGIGTGTGAGIGTGTGAGIGTGTGAGTGTGTGTTVKPQGNCANLTCMGELADAMSGCSPSGACTMQQSTTGASICYANGVKMSVTMNMTTMATNMTIKKGSTICLTGEMSGSTFVYKNAAGKTIATLDTTTSAMTCADGSTGIMDDTCGSDTANTGNTTSTSDCTQGTCTF